MACSPAPTTARGPGPGVGRDGARCFHLPGLRRAARTPVRTEKVPGEGLLLEPSGISGLAQPGGALELGAVWALRGLHCHALGVCAARVGCAPLPAIWAPW